MIVCFLIYIGNADQNPETLTYPDPNFPYVQYVTNDRYIYNYAPDWTCAQFAFPIMPYTPNGDYYKSLLYTGGTQTATRGNRTSPNQILGMNDCIYVNKGDQLKIYPFFFNGNASEKVDTKISLSEY